MTMPLVSSSGVSLRSRQLVLDELIKREVTGGARVDHRDSVTAVLVKGRHRLLVVVDKSATVHVDRLEQPRAAQRLFVSVLAIAIAALLVGILLIQLGVLPPATGPGP